MRQIDKDAWECEANGYDFHVRLEDGRYVIDVFASDVKDPDAAHVDEFEADSLKEAEKACKEYGAPQPASKK